MSNTSPIKSVKKLDVLNEEEDEEGQQKQQQLSVPNKKNENNNKNICEMISNLNCSKLAGIASTSSVADYSPSKSSSNDYSSPQSSSSSSQPLLIHQPQFHSRDEVSAVNTNKRELNETDTDNDESSNSNSNANNNKNNRHVTKLFVGNLPTSTTLSELLAVFKKYGPVNEKLSVVKDQNYAFIHFYNRNDAQVALREVNDSLFKDRYIRVQFSTSQGFTHQPRTKRNNNMHSETGISKNVPFNQKPSSMPYSQSMSSISNNTKTTNHNNNNNNNNNNPFSPGIGSKNNSSVPSQYFRPIVGSAITNTGSANQILQSQQNLTFNLNRFKQPNLLIEASQLNNSNSNNSTNQNGSLNNLQQREIMQNFLFLKRLQQQQLLQQQLQLQAQLQLQQNQFRQGSGDLTSLSNNTNTNQIGMTRSHTFSTNTNTNNSNLSALFSNNQLFQPNLNNISQNNNPNFNLNLLRSSQQFLASLQQNNPNNSKPSNSPASGFNNN